MTKIYLIAGEASGDFLGNRLIRNLQAISMTDVKFIGIGGKLMEEAGLEQSLFPINEINLMGFIEIIPHIFKITKLINHTVDHIVKQNPKLLITIDSPGFTYRVASKVRNILPNLKIIHIVAPSVWAYKPQRAIKYAKIYNCLFALLPFEPPYFIKVGLDCRYIGHPILEQEFYHNKTALKKEFNIQSNVKVICVTAGSRKGEILRHLPIFCEALNSIAVKNPNLLVLFVLADISHEKLILSILKDIKFNYAFSSDRLKAFAIADLALAKSGTNTLEIAASNTPMVVAYKLNIMSYFIIKLLIKIKYVSLINIIAQKEILPEFIQFKCRSELIAKKLEYFLLNNDAVNRQLIESQKVLKKLCPPLSNLSPAVECSQNVKLDTIELNSQNCRQDGFEEEHAPRIKIRGDRRMPKNSPSVSNDAVQPKASPSAYLARIIRLEFLNS